MKYFDLKKYFTDETNRLTKLNQPVFKSVDYNGKAEKKSVTIKNWPRELALFTESDINKAAWRQSYTLSGTKDSIVYNAIDTNLRTRHIWIKMSGEKVKSVRVVNFTTNLLYRTKDSLCYYPDSAYFMAKYQSVKILGTNNYQVIGLFKRVK